MAYDSVNNDRAAGDAWVMHQMQSNPKSAWPTAYNSENNNWNNTMHQESAPFPGYPSNYWYPQSQSTGPYANAYPAGSEVNGQHSYNPQAMAAPYSNGVYNPAQYPAGLLHPSNPFYCSDRAPQYHNPQGCPEPSTGAPGPPHGPPHHYPGQHCQTTPGYPPGAYPHYADGVPSLPPNPPYPAQQGLHSRAPPQPEGWPPQGGGVGGVYGPCPQQQWQPGVQPPHNHYGNQGPPMNPAGWQGPPAYDPKEPSYPGPPQRTQPIGPKNRPGPGKASDFSAPPQMYGKAGHGMEPKPPQGEPPPQVGPQLSDNPGLAQVQQVLGRVFMLQEDVDEFVGKKTDKSYKYLEELLTKELLVLDSVETRGQEAVRQARKEAVQMIQNILDRLEKKAF